MKSRQIRLALVVVGGLFAADAWANDYTFHIGGLAPDTPYTQIVNHVVPAEPIGTTFVDFFDFYIASGGGASSVAVDLNLQPFLNIDNLLLGLYSGFDAQGALLAGPVGGGVTLTAQLLTDTPYSLQISGVTSGSLGGSYSTAIAAVPEATRWQMMLIGLLAIGASFWRARHTPR